MHPLLAWLHPLADEVQSHHWPVELAPVKHHEQLFNLYHFGAGRPSRLALLLLGDLSDVTGDEWLLFLLHVEPFLVPIPYG
jgi:hypothetical protein